MPEMIVRRAQIEDIEGILSVEEEVWPEELRATANQFISRIETFPEGTIVAVVNGTIVGVIATEIIDYDFNQSALTWDEITDRGFIKETHNPNGDTLYGVDLSVSPFGVGASRLLMQEIGRLTIGHNLKQGILGARIPRYHKFADIMSAEEYVNTKRKNRSIDPELIFYARLGLKVVRVIPNYIEDPESCNYGVLLVWDNPFYGKPFPKLWSRIFRTK